jgi:hypothetical protein
MTARLAVGILALIIAVWMFHYEIVSPSTAAVFRLDRWTGALVMCTRQPDYSNVMHCG